MGNKVSDFMAEWISENIQPVAYQPEGDNSEALELAQSCMVAANAKGISKAELENEFGDIVEYISSELKRAVDQEVARLSGKSD